MRQKLPALLLLLIFCTTPALAQVEVNWERTGFSLPDFFGTDTERGFAYGEFDGDPRILVVSRTTTPPGIYVLDAETGQDAGTLNTDGLEGGTYLINDIGVSDDGVVYATNLVLSASEGTPFKVYRWTALDAEPEVAISFTNAPVRLGDRFTVVGSESDNSVTIYAGAARSNQVVRFTTDDNGATFSHEVISLEGFTEGGIQPSIAPVAPGEAPFYFNASNYDDAPPTPGRNPALFDADGTLLHEFTGDWIATNEMDYFEVGDRAFLVTFEGVSGDDQRAVVFDVTGGGSTFMYRTPSLGAGPNIFGAGDVEVVVGDDDEVTLFVLASNTGIASYSLELPEVFAGDFYVGAEGTAPGGADPHYASLADAFDAINGTEPTGAITLHITSDIDESNADLVLNQGAFSAEMPLTIRPADGTTPTVTLGANGEDAGDGANAGLAILNSGYVTIDGSSNGDGSRDLTFLVNDEALTRAIFVYGESPNVTVRNSVVATAVPASGVAAVRVAVGQAPPQGVLIENNQLGSEEAAFFHGVAFVGSEGSEIDADVIGNDIYASQRAITTFWVTDARYEGNRMWITGEYPTTSWSAGIYLVLASDVHVAGNELLSFTTNTETAQFNAGIVFNANLGDVFVYNNMFAVPEFSNNGTATDNPFFGFGANNAAGAGSHYFYHNTVRIGGSTQEGAVAGFGWAAGMNTTPQEWTFRNNIIAVEHDADNAYALHWPVPAGNEPDSDDNNLYVTGDDASVVFWRGTALEALSDWQFSTGLDGNSVSKAVEFVSDTDLRLTGASIGDQDLAAPRIEMVAVDIDGNERGAESAYMGAFEAAVDVSIERDRVAELPEAFELHQNYPNPFNPSTTISYTLREPGHVRVRVYNAAGQLIRELVDRYDMSGTHEVRFDAGDLASGMYLYRIEVGGRAQTKQMVLVK